MMFLSENPTLERFSILKQNKNRTALNLSGPLYDKNPGIGVLDELEHSKFIEFFGVITDLKIGPDRYVYVLSYDRGMVYRVIPSAIYTRSTGLR